MNTLTIIGQIVGFIAAAAMILSFQFKENKKLFTMQVISTALFSTHYLLLGIGGTKDAFSGMAQNLGGLIIRVIMLLGGKYKWAKSTVTMAALCTYSAVMAVLTYNGNWLSLLPTVGSIIIIGAMWTDNANVIRATQLSVTTPSWLIYNIFTNSIAGIITETFNLISITVYYIRQAIKKRREKNEAEKQ